MRMIDADELYKAKFHGVAEIVPPDEYNAESYKRGWNDAIDAITDESCTPTIEKEQWIPCGERLPEEKINPNTLDFEKVLCTTTFGDVRAYAFGTPTGMKEPHFWNGPTCVDEYVVAWQYVPEPYQGDGK